MPCDACDAAPVPDHGTPEAEAWDANATAACEARCEAKLRVQNRPITSRQDFLELALVVRGEPYDQFPDGSWHVHSMNEELEDAMHRAVFTVIEGGINV